MIFAGRATILDVLRLLRERPPAHGVAPRTCDAVPLARLRRTLAVVDLRETIRGPSVARGRAKGTRSLDTIDAICLHQTAAPITAASRCLAVPAHAVVLPDATIVLLHHPTAYLWHAHAANRRSIGIEISCRADGVEGDARTFWRSRRERRKGLTRAELRVEATDAQLEAALRLCSYYLDDSASAGGSITTILAHRQAHRSRIADPGSRIWSRVALPLALRYGLACGRDGLTLGSGHPIPHAWDHQCSARYSWRLKG